MRKNLDLSSQAVEALTIEAIQNKTCFKLYALRILEDLALNYYIVEKRSRPVADKNKRKSIK